jgi:hypothetical protein
MSYDCTGTEGIWVRVQGVKDRRVQIQEEPWQTGHGRL